MEQDAPKNVVAEPAVAATAPAPSHDEASPQAAPDDLNGTVDSKWFQDPSFVQELLGSLPGVDINDPKIQMALKEVRGDEKDNPSGSGGAGGSGGSSGGNDPKGGDGGSGSGDGNELK